MGEAGLPRGYVCFYLLLLLELTGKCLLQPYLPIDGFLILHFVQQEEAVRLSNLEKVSEGMRVPSFCYGIHPSTLSWAFYSKNFPPGWEATVVWGSQILVHGLFLFLRTYFVNFKILFQRE